MRNYTDKKVFLGIDVHKKHYSITAICEGQVVKKDTIPAQPAPFFHFDKFYF
ncbi:MAG: hypothetical protein HW387_560 [Parachlamydiales bacterium]|nr:hypothetical protein [Parachlamydiales bacterium]